MKNVFDFQDYKLFLANYELNRKGLERGFRSRLATHLGCQSGYVSHVLNGNAHLSLEQAIACAGFIRLDAREKKYFLLLVEFARAGTTELQLFFETELIKFREEHLNIKERVGSSKTLSEQEQSVYYSSWHFLAVHVISSLPGYDNAAAISAALSIPESVVAQVLLFLLQTGIVINDDGQLTPGVTQVHLNRESPLIRQHHTNWRIAAMQSVINASKTDVHYSTVSTLSKTDAENLRAEMVKLIENYIKTVKPSKEEVMYGFNLDFYNLVKK